MRKLFFHMRDVGDDIPLINKTVLFFGLFLFFLFFFLYVI